MMLRVLLAALLLLGITPTVHAAESSQLTVLGYHEINDAIASLIPEYAVTPTMFVRQIDWLRNNGFHFVSVDDVLADRAGLKRLPDKAILLTFDDAKPARATIEAKLAAPEYRVEIQVTALA